MKFTEGFMNDLQYSRLLDTTPDKRYFPNFYKAKGHEVILNPGDCLFLPAGWWHWVFSEGTGSSGLNIALNFWYATDWRPWDKTVKYPVTTKHTLCDIDYIDIMQKLENRFLVHHSAERKFAEYRVYPKVESVLPVTFSLLNFNEMFETKSDIGMYATAIPDPRMKKFTPMVNGFSAQIDNAYWWVNNGDVTTLCHYDIADNFLCQLEGTKRILLFHQDERENLYPYNPYDPRDLKFSFFSGDTPGVNEKHSY